MAHAYMTNHIINKVRRNGASLGNAANEDVCFWNAGPTGSVKENNSFMAINMYRDSAIKVLWRLSFWM